MSTGSELLVIGGRSGVGKSSVAFALHDQLAAEHLRHAVIEGDVLDLAWPAPWEHRLTERNLAAIWSNYRALGYERLIYTNTMSVMHTDELAAAMGDDPVVTAVLLTADDATARARLAGREHGDSLAAHVQRSDAAARVLATSAAGDVHRLSTEGRVVDGGACRGRSRAGDPRSVADLTGHRRRRPREQDRSWPLCLSWESPTGAGDTERCTPTRAGPHQAEPSRPGGPLGPAGRAPYVLRKHALGRAIVRRMDASGDDSSTPPADPPVREAHAIRALSHPLRLRLLEVLALEGTATATRCAELVRESVASCSFHLRTLARHGFIERAPSQTRERPWRLTQVTQSIEPTRTTLWETWPDAGLTWRSWTGSSPGCAPG